MSELRLMAIHAHPDDESSKGAATMAKYVAEDCRVKVVTATGGEAGSILNPAMDRPEVIENITEVRRGEMERAAKALGVEHEWLGYIDSGLPEGDPLPPLADDSFARTDLDQVARRLVASIRDFRPHVIITYDENGGYPHPDHIKTHEMSIAAWERAGDPTYAPETGAAWTPLKLYYVHGFTLERFSALHGYFVQSGKESPFAAIVDRIRDRGDHDSRTTTRVSVAEFFPQRDEALLAHATQIDPQGMFFAMPRDVEKLVWPFEEFELAAARVAVSLPEDDLFEGIDPAQADTLGTQGNLPEVKRY